MISKQLLLILTLAGIIVLVGVTSAAPVFEYNTTLTRYGAVIQSLQPWDDGTIQEPTVIYDSNPMILSGNDNVFKLWYHGGDFPDPGNLGYAESTDGIHWTPYAQNPLLKFSNGVIGYCCPFVVKSGSTYYLYIDLINSGGIRYQMDVYTSTDGVSWVLAKSGAITTSPGWKSYHLGNQGVIVNNGQWYMMKEAWGSSTGTWTLGLFTSSNGLEWTEHSSNPSARLSGSLSGPEIHIINYTYYMWTHGNAISSDLPNDIYAFYSSDMINWYSVVNGAKADGSYPGLPIIARQGTDEGEEQRYSQVADPSVVEANGITFFYYGAYPNANNYGANYDKLKMAYNPLTLQQIVEGTILDPTSTPTTIPTTVITTIPTIVPSPTPTKINCAKGKCKPTRSSGIMGFLLQLFNIGE